MSAVVPAPAAAGRAAAEYDDEEPAPVLLEN